MFVSQFFSGAIIATWREKGCATLWKVVKNLPLQNSNTICYKSCYLIHKVLRDGYTEVMLSLSKKKIFLCCSNSYWLACGSWRYLFSFFLSIIYIYYIYNIKVLCIHTYIYNTHANNILIYLPALCLIWTSCIHVYVHVRDMFVGFLHWQCF